MVVGEFNSGKSAFINALVGESILQEGVTPTTSQIHLLRHGEAGAAAVADGAIRIVARAELLADVHIVDTPGTNAIIREHERLTTEFIPRADLVLFVTSADRPFTETGTVFLASIRGWGKKVVVIINKVDIPEHPGSRKGPRVCRRWCACVAGRGARDISCECASGAEGEARRPRRWGASGFEPLEQFVLKTLEEGVAFGSNWRTPWAWVTPSPSGTPPSRTSA